MNNRRIYSLVWQGDGVAEWSVWQKRRLAANREDPQRGMLTRAMFEYLVPNSCNWSFHERLNQ